MEINILGISMQMRVKTWEMLKKVREFAYIQEKRKSLSWETEEEEAKLAKE